MPQLVRWHQRLGELALRLFLLQLLWVLGVLAGAVALGVLPATAALCTVLRDDQRERAHEELGEHPPSRRRLWTEFWGSWRAEFWRSQRLGGVLILAWLVLALDRSVLTGGIPGVIAPLVSGLLVVLTVVLVLLSAVVWPLSAHFADPVGRLLRMGLVVLVRRPSLSLALALVLMAGVWVAQTLPGVVPVFGIALPAWAVTVLLWRTGAMPLTPRASAAPPG